MKTAMLRLAVGGLAAVAMLAAPPMAGAQVPTKDSVAASGFAGNFANIDTNVTSAPSGLAAITSSGVVGVVRSSRMRLRVSCSTCTRAA